MASSHLPGGVVERPARQPLVLRGPGDGGGYQGRGRAQAGHRGQHGARPACSASDRSARAWAAAASIPSLTRRARQTVTPSPRPGKMSALLACAIWYSRRGT